MSDESERTSTRRWPARSPSSASEHQGSGTDGRALFEDEEGRERLEKAVSRYPRSKPALLPMLDYAQERTAGSRPASMEQIAEALELTPAYVCSVATFYTMYNKQPTGRHMIQVCTCTACHLCGADDVFEALPRGDGHASGRDVGERPYMVMEAECLGACGFATAVQVNERYFENVTPDDGGRHVDSLALGPKDGRSDGLPYSHDLETATILSRHFGDESARRLETWVERGGYEGLQKACRHGAPTEIVQVVKDSGLRGRGGAGFPTGMKWSFMPQEPKGPHYLCCNADESEPGAFKDREILRWVPHLLIEGCLIAARAIRAQHAYIYVRGEYFPFTNILNDAVVEAYEAGYIGENILGSGWDCDLTVHIGAGAYIAGEETGLMSSLVGRPRGAAGEAAVPGPVRASSAARPRSTTSRRCPPSR